MIIVKDFFGLLKGKDINKARKNLKKYRNEFSKDAENRESLLYPKNNNNLYK